MARKFFEEPLPIAMASGKVQLKTGSGNSQSQKAALSTHPNLTGQTNAIGRVGAQHLCAVNIFPFFGVWLVLLSGTLDLC
jgi:hypothetical protein